MLTLNVNLAAEAFILRNDRTLFSHLAAEFERAVIYLLSQGEVAGVSKYALEAFQKSYASTAYRCRFSNCSRSSTGFPSSELRGQHEAAHLHRVYCKVVSCQWNRIGFKNKNGLDVHTRKHHREKTAISIPPEVRRILGDREGDKRKTNDEANDSEIGAPNHRKMAAKDVKGELTRVIDRLWSLSLKDIPNALKREETDWNAVFNPDVPRIMDVDHVITFSSHSAVTDVCFSPDGRYVAVCGDRETALFDPLTGVFLVNLAHSTRMMFVRSACFSFDGKFLATSGEDSKVLVRSFTSLFFLSIVGADWIKVWDVQQGSVFCIFDGHEQAVHGVDFAPNGRSVASCGADCTVRMWDVETRRQAGHFEARAGLMQTKFSPDGKFIFAACLDKAFYMWDVLQGHLVARIEGHSDAVYDIKLRSDGCFATASLDKTLKLWDQVRVEAEEGPASRVLVNMEGHKVLAILKRYSDNTC